MRVENKVALLTGAAAGLEGELMGFGGAVAHVLAREGAKIVLTDIRDDLGERSAKALCEAGKEAIYTNLDVTNESSWQRAVSLTLSKFGRLDILFNNAGIALPAKIEDMTEEMWDKELDIHAKGVFLGTKTVIPAMRKAGGGSIINTSSIMGIVGSPRAPAYSAAKGAIRFFSKTAALQYAKENIRVNSIHPGYVVTPLTDQIFADPDITRELIRQTPMGRLGSVEDIANGVLFLASDESNWMTGSELVIDGGMTAR